MTADAGIRDRAFKRALIVSAAAHSLLLLFIVLNPRLPRPTPKGVIHYLPMGYIGGGGGDGRPAGGGGGGGAAAAPTELGTTEIKRESLRDLTTAQKVQPKVESELRYPTDKTKTKSKTVPEKKAAISKPDPGAKTSDKATAGQPGGVVGGLGGAGGAGSGLTIGPGGSGEGLGPGFGEGLGLLEFPYAYYLQNVREKIAGNWFPGSVDPGPGTLLQTHVYFRIFRAGTISPVEVKASSGIRPFDLLAIRAVTYASPFPPLPADYDADYLGVNLVFEHAR